MSIFGRFKNKWVGAAVFCSFLCAAFGSNSSVLLAFQKDVQVLKELQDQDQLIERLGNRTSAIFQDGDRLTIMFRSDAAKAELANMLGGELIQPNRDGLHIAQMIIPDSNKLLMSYALKENDENVWRFMKHFRGEDAPQIPQSVTRLRGEHHKFQLESKHLEEPRRVEVYVPGVESDKPLPVIYLTDGNALESIVGSLDWKIRNGEIAPMVVVGIHNGGYIGDRKKVYNPEFDRRAKEYLSGIGSDRYEKHNLFMSEELFPYIEKKFNASNQRKDRALSGYSNGGAFAVTASVDHPDWFGNVFAYSVAFFDRDELRKAVKEKSLPEYRLAAGTLEHFIKGTRDAHEILETAGVSTSLRTFVAGHDPLMWKIALLEDLALRFPGESKSDH